MGVVRKMVWGRMWSGYQAQGVKPLFPFGYGLSYTTFELTEVSVDPGERPGSTPITVGATVRNTGPVAGAEVVQVYLGLPASTNQPPKRLVGFQKVKVEPGASRSDGQGRRDMFADIWQTLAEVGSEHR